MLASFWVVTVQMMKTLHLMSKRFVEESKRPLKLVNEVTDVSVRAGCELFGQSKQENSDRYPILRTINLEGNSV